MKKLGNTCTKLSSLLFLLIAALAFLPCTDLYHRSPILTGILLLPATFLSAVAAVIHHRLPKNQREPLRVSWWGLRLHIEHPYWFLLLLASMNILCFVTVSPNIHFALLAEGLLALTILLVEIFAVVYDH